ncbi:MAG: glycosyltransferase family 2 protein [Bacteroidetes bacterium]|uniref:Glycosyltransferase family 2 protein n=1 Tax=Candidatus Gallipaludibacter merdavium TaxID=2840839 RepID=A0A9D9HRY1_9BACT|nr:glycosyltransferase family 2 protein [Candidatus Gallipaludibacter merdavium]
MVVLNVSIVIYKTNEEKIHRLVALLRQCKAVNDVFIIDNSPSPFQTPHNMDATYIFNNNNCGYGRAHNIALRKTIENKIPYHLVLNPDVVFDPSIINELLEYMEGHTSIGSLMPKIYYPNGDLQYLCKLVPAPMDLFGRRFLPKWMMKKRKRRFELYDSGYSTIMNVPYLSGCFMLLRTSTLEDVGLFDERFFLYPEDIDLTRRIHKKYKTIFYPYVSVIHEYGRGSYKSMKLLYFHIVNMCRYFNKWGWFFDKERKEINARCIAENISTSDQRR